MTRTKTRLITSTRFVCSLSPRPILTAPTLVFFIRMPDALNIRTLGLPFMQGALLLFPFFSHLEVSLCRSRTGSPLDRQLTSVCGLGAPDAVYIPGTQTFSIVRSAFLSFLNIILLLIFISLYRSLPSYLDFLSVWCWAPTCLDDLHSTLIIRTTVHNTSFFFFAILSSS